MARDKKEDALIKRLKSRNARRVRKEVRRLKFNLWLVGASREAEWRVELDYNLDVYMITYIENFIVTVKQRIDYRGIPYINYSVTRWGSDSLSSCYWSEVKDYIGKELADKEYLNIMNQK